MSLRSGWVAVPPAPCDATGNDEAARGPYYVEPRLIARVKMTDAGPRVVPRVKPLVHSAGHIKAICDAPGSPYIAITRDEASAHARVADDLAEARERIASLEAEVATLRSGVGAIDVQALASALVVPLRNEFRAKPGPKPKDAA